MPLAMQIWNTYRNRVLAYWLQYNGVPIVPNVRWGDERTYAFAFEGLARGGTVAVSTNGCIRSKIDQYYFHKGLVAMIASLKPACILTIAECLPTFLTAARKEVLRPLGLNTSLTLLGRDIPNGWRKQ